MKTIPGLLQAGFGGGCHWCTEAVFASLKGITKVQQGWIAAAPPDETFSEAVLLTYDPSLITLAALINIHITTHAATSAHARRQKYRSAVYYLDDETYRSATNILDSVQRSLKDIIITRVLPFASFKENEAAYRDYYYSNPEKPFCTLYISPKINLLRQEFGGLVK